MLSYVYYFLETKVGRERFFGRLCITFSVINLMEDVLTLTPLP